MTPNSPTTTWRSPGSGVELFISGWSGFDGLRSAVGHWREILYNSGVDPLCNAPDWTECYVRCFVKSETVFGWTLFDNNKKPVAVLAFREEPPRSFFSLRRAIFAADGTFDSDYMDFPAIRGFEPVVCEAAIDLLAKRRGIQAAVFAGIPEDSPLLNLLRESCDRRGLPRRETGVPCGVAALADTFDNYLKTLKPRVRSKIRQAMRNASERGARFEWCHDLETLNLHLDNLYELHGMRWRAAGRPGSFTDERRREFYRKLSPGLIAENRLRFARLEMDNKPVAYQIGALAGGVYYQLQEGFHTDFGDLRVGTALRAHVIQSLIAEGVRRYDFMAGESQHKAEWGAVPRPSTTVAFALPNFRARIAYGIRKAVDEWRKRRNANNHLPPESLQESETAAKSQN